MTFAQRMTVATGTNPPVSLPWVVEDNDALAALKGAAIEHTTQTP